MNRALLVCHVDFQIGVGHLSRLLALAQALLNDKKVTPEFLIFGDAIKKNELADFVVHNFDINDDFNNSVKNTLNKNNFEFLVLDLYPQKKFENLGSLLSELKQHNIFLISIDSLIEYCNILDLIWFPSFNFDVNKYTKCSSKLKSGWDSFLIQKRLHHNDWIPGSKVLILTGGSDSSNLGATLPSQLDKLLNNNIEIHWVRGPFSRAPNLPKKRRLNWIIHNAPDQLDDLIVQSNYVLTVFGVSFFEVLQYGIPTVVFSPYGSKDNDELRALLKEDVAMVADNSAHGIDMLVRLIDNDILAKDYSLNSIEKMSINGAQNLSNEIYSLMEVK